MTDPLVIIAGIPLEVHRRAQTHPERAGWEIRPIPSHHHKRADLSSIWPRVMEAADHAPDAGVHLFLAHDRESERPTFRELPCRCHRATWLGRELSRQYGQEKFLEAFDELVDFEDEWRTRIRPRINSPLLLPETVFLAEQSAKDTWSRARNVSRVRDTLDAVERTIARFTRQHRNRDGWLDCRQLIFQRGAPHGGHGIPKWRHRKFTLCLPEGFHFDVRHSRNRDFRVQSRSGLREFAEYTNIDHHGFLRGGR